MVFVLLSAIKGLLGQVPDVIESAGRARSSSQCFKQQPDLPPSADDEEPALAA